MANKKEKKTVKKYSTQCMKYLRNAFKSMEEGNFDKASEFLWGSTSQALKAVASAKGIALRSHRDLWDYAEGLAKERNDRGIYDVFFIANSLHGNFYEVTLGDKEIRDAADRVKELVAKLLRLIGMDPDKNISTY